MKWKILETQRNPMQLVEIKGVTKRVRKKVVLTSSNIRLFSQSFRTTFKWMVMILHADKFPCPPSVTCDGSTWRNGQSLSFPPSRAPVPEKNNLAATFAMPWIYPIHVQTCPHQSYLLIMTILRCCVHAIALQRAWIYSNASAFMTPYFSLRTRVSHLPFIPSN